MAKDKEKKETGGTFSKSADKVEPGDLSESQAAHLKKMEEAEK